MAQVTTNTEINTINILQEAPSVETDDLFLLQRGSSTLKLKSQNLSIDVNQLKEIENKRVLGNISGAPASPYGITLKTENDPDSDSDEALVTERRINKKVSDLVTDFTSNIGISRTFKGSTTSNSIDHGGDSIPDMFFCHIGGVTVFSFKAANGTDGGLKFGGLKATTTKITIIDRDISDLNGGTRYFSAIWF